MPRLPSTSITLRGVGKQFGAQAALQGIDLDVRSGELIGLLGPSGSGKTTLLRIIAGLETPEAGEVLFGAQTAAHTPLRKRGVGFVFQHYALFRHMTIFENIAFGLRVRPKSQRPGNGEIARRVEELLALVQLDNLGGRYPSRISGGQRQRVALARALAIEPRVLLLDEPFGALDTKVRKELRRWLRQLQESVGVTTVFVTHDQEEALELADRVVVMSAGKIEQIGKPADVYNAPTSPFVHEFLGDTNRFDCRIEAGIVTLPSGIRIGTVDTPDGPAVAYVRPHDIFLRPEPTGPGTICHAHAVGPLARLLVDIAGMAIEITIPGEAWANKRISIGARVDIDIRHGTVFSNGAGVGLALE